MAKMIRSRDAHRPATRIEREQATIAQRILEKAGLAFAFERGSNHLCVVVEGRRVPLSGTPRNEGDALTYTSQRVSRLVREIEAETKAR